MDFRETSWAVPDLFSCYPLPAMRTRILLLLLLCSPFPVFGQISFEDITDSAGISTSGVARGVSFGDYDNDGFQDIYFTFSNSEPNVLYRNNGDLTFTDVTEEAGVGDDQAGNSAVWGDFDNDGDEDLYVGNVNEPNVFYRNEGDGTFTDITEEMGLGSDRFARSVHFVDLDHDGWLDLYIHNINEQNEHYRNNEGMSFTDVTFLAGTPDTQVAQGAIHFDYDNDGDQDLYLTHDANQACIMYQNDGAGNFTNVAAEIGLDLELNAMGVDFADINNDGFFDVYVTNLGINALMVYDPEQQMYTFETFDAGPEGNGMSWGTFFFDADNDGLEDIYVCNDSFFSPLPNFFYRNNGDGTFTSILEENPICGFDASWGGATADLDMDGRMEVVIANANADASNQVFYNTTEDAGNWVGVKLRGTISNRSAIGTRVTVYAGGLTRMDEVAGGSGWASQHSPVLHFGLGEEAAIDSALVTWPSGLMETYYNVQPQTYHEWIEGEVPDIVIPDPYVTLGQIDLETASEVKDSTETGVSVYELTTTELKVFPNPGRDVVQVEATSPIRKVRLLDGFGRDVLLVAGEGRRTLAMELKSLNSGQYLVLVETEEGISSRTLLLE